MPLIRNLKNTDFDTLFAGFERAFADYEISFNKDEVRAMLKRRGFDDHLSFAAFVDNEIVSFTFNGIGQFNGLKTAYDTGTGTAQDYRGRHLAGQIFSTALPFLKEDGVEQYLLEVLQNNLSAIKVYRDMGFEVTRELNCYRRKISQITNLTRRETTSTDLKTKNSLPIEIKPITVESVRELCHFNDFQPSWQNSIESIERGREGLHCLGAFINREPSGYCVYDPMTGDIAQLAVKPEYRRQGVGTALLSCAIEGLETDAVKILNVDAADVTLPAFLQSKNIPLSTKQFEMILPL